MNILLRGRHAGWNSSSAGQGWPGPRVGAGLPRAVRPRPWCSTLPAAPKTGASPAPDAERDLADRSVGLMVGPAGRRRRYSAARGPQIFWGVSCRPWLPPCRPAGAG